MSRMTQLCQCGRCNQCLLISGVSCGLDELTYFLNQMSGCRDRLVGLRERIIIGGTVTFNSAGPQVPVDYGNGTAPADYGNGNNGLLYNHHNGLLYDHNGNNINNHNINPNVLHGIPPTQSPQLNNNPNLFIGIGENILNYSAPPVVQITPTNANNQQQQTGVNVFASTSPTEHKIGESENLIAES
eukprot:244054_1